MPVRAVRIVLLIACLVTGLALLPTSTQAAGVVGSGTAASCSEAALVSALAGGGAVSFNCGGAATITLTSAKSLVSSVTLNGAGLITISGNNATQLFIVNGGVTLTLNNITLTKGSASDRGGAIDATGGHIVLNNAKIVANRATNQGGGIYCYVGTGGTLSVTNSVIDSNVSVSGSGIYNDGCVATISGSQFTNNKTSSASSSAGGGLYTSGNLTLSNTGFSGNKALDGGGLYVATGATATLSHATLDGNSGGYGGGFENSGTIVVNDSLISNNSVTGSGGGLWNLYGTVTLNRTTVSGNTAAEGGGVNSYGNHVALNNVNVINNIANGSSGGGGIYHSGGTMFVTNATISGNRATASTGSGGGISQKSDDNMTLTNVTISDNQAAYFGGGIYHYSRYAVLTNVTLGRNTALAGNAIYEDANVTPSTPGIIQIRNSVLFGATNNCDGGLFDSLGYNISDGTCSSLASVDDLNAYGDVGMGPLAFNGGSFAMKTILPGVNSPVVNAGNPINCTSLDQRGAARIDGCDIGAVEYGALLPFAYLPAIAR